MRFSFSKWLMPAILFASLSAQSAAQAQRREKTVADSLDFKIGQMIMIGIDDRKALTENDRLTNELRDGKIGGVVLFEKNIAPTDAKELLKKLITALKAAAPAPIFVSIDEEGGQVHRMKPKYGFVSMPSAQYLGRLNNQDSTLYYNRRLADELAYVGINLNYAPDVDVAINPNNPVIVKPGRSFSADPKVVAQQAAWCIQAHHEKGIRTILKHFPGHGSSATDSHLGIADVTNTWRPSELEPYKILMRSGQIDAIMGAHIVNKKLDPEGNPATLSRRMIKGLLRDSLGYNGPVFSDDMQMGAITRHYGLEKAINLSINAGVDVLMFGNTVGDVKDRVTATQVQAIIKKLVADGQVSRAQIDAAYRRIKWMKSRNF